jgi:serine protease AprX
MKKLFLLLFGFQALAFVSSAQLDTAKRYWVQFADKKNSPYTLSNPSAYLSPRAIQRRLNHSIAIDQRDLPVNPSYIDSLIVKGAHIHCKSKWLNGAVVKVPSKSVINAIRKLPFVIDTTSVMPLAHPVDPSSSARKLTFRTSPVDARAGGVNTRTSSLNYGPSLNQINMLRGVCLHDAGYQGQGMVIGILDAGFYHADQRTAFDSLRAHNQILGTWDFVAENSKVYEDHFHGMCVLSCMGANLPGQLIGTAPKAKYWLLRTEQDSSEYVIEEYNWAAGAEFADSVGVDVINTSLGYTTFDDPRQNATYADMNGHKTIAARAANCAANKGLAVVCAAGNEGGGSWNYVGTPGDADSVLAVGAVDASGAYASFSSHGPNSSGMIKPSVDAEGQGSVVADWNSNGTVLENGTSFASPIMCGLVTCLWQAHPQVSNMDLFRYIEESADQYIQPDTLLGYGKPDFCAANLTMGVPELADVTHDFLSALHPNPFNDSFDFLFWSKSSQEVTVKITDLSGRVVLSEMRLLGAESYNSFHMSGLNILPAGLYILALQSDSGLTVRKVVKQ